MSRRSNKRKSSGAHAGDAYTVAPKFTSDRAISPWTKSWILGLLLVGATVIVYQRVAHAGYIWDDDVYITGNILLTAPDGLRRIWFSLDSPSQYFPLVYTTFRIEHALWGLHPAGYHLVNLFLHIGNALLLWRLLSVLRVPGAWLAAAFFALHPVQVESVAWVTERKNVLMGFFFLLALLAWVAFVGERNGKRWKYYGLALICYALALCSKTTACTLPAALLLIFWLKAKRIDWSSLLQVAPFVVLGIGMGLVSIWWERYHIGTHGPEFGLGLLERILLANRALWFYAGKLLWPVHLSFSYPRWSVLATNPQDYIWPLLTIAAGVVIYLVRGRLGRATAIAALFFVATLSPMLGFIMLYTFKYSFVADHYQYLALVGPVSLASAALTRLIRKPILAFGVGCSLLSILGVLTWKQEAIYTDAETLWKATLVENPNSWMAYNNLGILQINKKQWDESIMLLEKALSISPRNGIVSLNLGNALFRKGQVDEAIKNYERGLSYEPTADLHLNLGNALVVKGQLDEAISHFQNVLASYPTPEAYNSLGYALFAKGSIDNAITQYKAALRLNPNYSEAHLNYGIALQANGQIEATVSEYEKALEIRPDFAEAANNLAWILATCPKDSIRDGARAVALAETADRLDPGNNPAILDTLAAAYAEAGRFPEAVVTAEKALQNAHVQSDFALAADLQRKLQLYRTNNPLRDHAVANR